MNRQSHLNLGVGTLLVFFLFSLPVSASKIDEPKISDQQVERLKTLPYSISGQTSLVFRRKHVEDVLFDGAALKSEHGFVLRNGIMHQGLWLRLRNRRGDKSSNATILFNQPVNAKRYNSIVVWLRSNLADQRFWIGLQDDDWVEPNKAQARSNIIPLDGLPKKELIQVAIPFSTLFAEKKLNYSRLNGIQFEFGRKVGNSKKARIEVLGVAFVRQDKKLARVHSVSEKMFLAKKGRRKSTPKPTIAKKKVVKKKPAPSPSPKQKKAETVKAKKKVKKKPTIVYSVPDPSLPKVYFSAKEKGLAVFEKPFEKGKAVGKLKSKKTYLALQSARLGKKRWFYLELGKNKAGWVNGDFLDLNHTEESEEAASPPINLKPVFEYLVLVPIRSVAKVIMNVVSWRPTLPSIPKELFLFVAFPPLVVLLFIYFYRRQRDGFGPVKMDRIFHEVQIPVFHGDINKETLFWKEYATTRVGRAWISVNHADLDKRPEEEYRGEEFLLRQMRTAKESGVPLIPSVCFVRTVFNYDTFLAHPDLYLTKAIPKSETHYSDEELRLHHMGYFPAWIPPYWQKQHGLPQRILVAFGKLPGTVFTTDSVQYNLASPALRKMAIRLIKKIAKRSSAVRIEGAAALLNSSLRLYWADQISEDQIQRTEFWKDVIQKVRKEHPRMQFIADGAGTDPRALKQLGFDYFENDRVRDVFANQIRMETAGHLKKIFSEMDKDILFQSIFNVTPIIDPSRPSNQGFTQGTLASVLLGLLPGNVNFRGRITPDLKQILRVRSRWPALKAGDFAILETTSPSIFAFARWHAKKLVVAVANFGKGSTDALVNLGPTLYGFDERRLYLFNDILHGTAQLESVKREKADGPAMAIWGQDLRDTGLPVQMPGLSLKIISVNLTRSLSKKPKYERTIHTLK